LKASTFGLICYGGVCPDLQIVFENALQASFNTALNLHLWSKGGAVRYKKKRKKMMKPKGLAQWDGHE
jgi:hypothetical protein